MITQTKKNLSGNVCFDYILLCIDYLKSGCLPYVCFEKVYSRSG